MDAGRFGLAYSRIWLLTDYGRRDGFVASCHGVIAQIAPSVRVETISDDVPPRDVRHGAAVLAQTVRYLPPAVIVGVVDPGVGTDRRAVAVTAASSVLVGPDNGLLIWATDALGGASAAFEIAEPAFRLRTSAHTFDGRDVFVPAAAHIATGVPLSAVGPALPVGELIRLPTPRAESRAGLLDTEVLTVDHFGNVQLAATGADLVAADLAAGPVTVDAPGRSYAVAVGTTFADVPAGSPVLFVDSAGHVALAVNGADAADQLDLHPGDGVTLTHNPG